MQPAQPLTVARPTNAPNRRTARRYYYQTDPLPSGHVPWWPRPDVTLHGILVHVLAETTRHAGHADILREQLDGRTGMFATNANQTAHDEQWWSDYRTQIETAARTADSK